MKVSLFEFKPLLIDMRKKNVDREHFIVTYNSVVFDVIFTIDTTPFKLLIGAKKHNWACLCEMENGFKVEMPDSKFYSLSKILNLKPSKDSLTSFAFLKYIASHAPKTCSERLVNPSVFKRFTLSYNSDIKDIFIGWNDHKLDKRKAHNFNKTEEYFGKNVADYCRDNNISSMWTSASKANGIKSDLKLPWK